VCTGPDAWGDGVFLVAMGAQVAGFGIVLPNGSLATRVFGAVVNTLAPACYTVCGADIIGAVVD